MLYAKASLNGKGKASFGLRHIRKLHHAVPSSPQLKLPY